MWAQSYLFRKCEKIASYHAYHNSIIRIGVTALVFELQEIKGVLAGHIVAMVTNCVTKLTATCAQMIGQFF